MGIQHGFQFCLSLSRRCIGDRLCVSLALALTGGLLGEVWNWVVEGHRIGNPHMSYRADQLFWHNHRLELFAAALLIYWLAAIIAACRVRLAHSDGR